MLFSFGGLFAFSIGGMLFLLLGLVGLVLWVFMMFKAYQQEKFMLPIIGPIAENIARSRFSSREDANAQSERSLASAGGCSVSA